MKCRPLDNDSWRVHFDTAEYNQLLESSPNRDAHIAKRLMAHSLRVKTASDVCLNQFNKKQTRHGTIWMLSVEAKDTTNRDSTLLPREVWVCEPLIREIKEFTGVEDLDAHEEPIPLFTVSKRTIQNWVKKTAENAATRTGNKDFLKVSSHDFRRYFASHMLYRHKVDAEVVRQLGGWRSPRSMMEYLLLPDDVLADELGEAKLLGSEADKRRSEDTPYREKTALKTLAKQIEKADRAERRRLAKEMEGLFDDVDDLGVVVAGSTDTAESAASELTDEDQSSLSQLEGLDTDETATTYPVAAAKMAYVAGVVLTSWSATFGALA